MQPDDQSRHYLERIEFESLRFACPAFADELVGREAFERLQPPATGHEFGRCVVALSSLEL